MPYQPNLRSTTCYACDIQKMHARYGTNLRRSYRRKAVKHTCAQCRNRDLVKDNTIDRKRSLLDKVRSPIRWVQFAVFGHTARTMFEGGASYLEVKHTLQRRLGRLLLVDERMELRLMLKDIYQ